MVLLCPKWAREGERGKGSLLVSYFSAYFITFCCLFYTFFPGLFFTSCPVYLRVCVGASVSVCV